MTSTSTSSHRQRRPQRQQQHDKEHLQQVLARLQSALRLGLRPSSSHQKIGQKWFNTDAEVQVQATRAIMEFVRTLPPQHGRSTLPQMLVEESIAALEGLLGAESEAVYSKAAECAAGLVAAIGDGLLGYGGERLVGPLAHLLKCSKPPTSISAATALQGILGKVKPRAICKGFDDGMWGSLEDAHALSVVVKTVEEDSGNTGRDAAFMELLAVILERWSESRYRIGCIKSMPATLQVRCMTSNVPVAQGALHALSALALCGCAASVLLRDAETMWSAISFCLQSSRPHSIQLEALRLLTSLCKTSSFGESFTGPHVEGIAAGCLRALQQVRSFGEMRLAPEVQVLVVEAANATSSILSWPGLHHTAFIQNGIEECLLAALSRMHRKREEVDQVAQHPPKTAVDRRARGNKLNPRLRPLLLEIVGWLGAHSRAQSGSHFSRAPLEQLSALACSALSKAVRKKGRSPHWDEMVNKTQSDMAQADGDEIKQDGQPASAQEVVQICKAVLLLISSPSQAIVSCTRKYLEDALVSHDLDWLPSLVTTLTLSSSNTIKIDNIQMMINLLSLACVSWLDMCQEQLLKLKVLEAVLEIVRAHVGDKDQRKTESLSLMSTGVYPVGVETCCVDGRPWEGCDSVLFCALWALYRLLQCSDRAKQFRETITEDVLDSSTWDDLKEGKVLHLLWTVAGDKERSAGVRWCAVYCLACFGIYGFPSIVGKDMKRARDDPSWADVTFVLGDRSCLPAHGVMLAARCESLLPATFQSNLHASLVTSDLKSSRETKQTILDNHQESEEIVGPLRSIPVEVQVSARFTRTSLKKLLEFVYTGIVCIPQELVSELKILAKRCGLEPLASLLQGKSPVWGQPPAPCNLSLALDKKGYLVSDILVRSVVPLNEISGKVCLACNAIQDHLHANRIVLSSRCNYFQALFRSGMRDSVQREVKLSAGIDTIAKFLQYLYGGDLTKEAVSDCAWRHLGTNAQLGFLESLVELAQLAEQWILEDLQQLTAALIEAYLNQNIHLCVPILSLAADKQLWTIVESCATCLAPAYPQLRDSGALDDLQEELRDLVRAANVKLFMM